MAQIFLSHATADRELAESLTHELRLGGFDVLTSEPPAGAQIADHLRRMLLEADAVVVLVTTLALQNQWVQHEIGMAAGYSAQSGRPLLLPVLMEPVRLPEGLKDRMAIDGRDGELSYIAARIKDAVSHYLGALQALEQEQRQAARRVEATAGEYIGRSRASLDLREKQYRRTALLWYLAAFLSLLGGVGFALWRAHVATAVDNWPALAGILLLGLLVISMLVGLSKLAFTLGKAHMVEALRNADRSHAISFGEFYLRAYGEKASWAEVKEAFQHWNVDKGSSFAEQSAREFDPKLAEAIADLAKAFKTSGDEK